VFLDCLTLLFLQIAAGVSNSSTSKYGGYDGTCIVLVVVKGGHQKKLYCVPDSSTFIHFFFVLPLLLNCQNRFGSLMTDSSE
jgi:hypothetical protein